MFGSSIGTAMPVSFVNGCMSSPGFPISVFQQVTHVSEPPLQRRRRGHRRTDQVRPASRSLPAAEIAVGSRSAALARFQLVAVDRRAQGSTRVAPFEAGRDKNTVQSFLLRLR